MWNSLGGATAVCSFRQYEKQISSIPRLRSVYAGSKRRRDVDSRSVTAFSDPCRSELRTICSKHDSHQHAEAHLLRIRERHLSSQSSGIPKDLQRTQGVATHRGSTTLVV